MFKKHLFPPGKRPYIQNRKERKQSEKCILCEIVDNSDNVVKLDVYRTENFVVSVNLYPYNPGHIMIFPKKHIEKIEDFPENLYNEFFTLKKKCIEILNKIYSPGGFNIGFNVGRAAGASIEHIHMHIVPRFENELGFVDILAGSKIFIDTPEQIYNILKKEFEASGEH
jgi:ATP adenylyltransferase